MFFSWLVTGRHFCLCYQVADIRGRELKCEGVGLKPERSGIALVLWHLQKGCRTTELLPWLGWAGAGRALAWPRASIGLGFWRGKQVRLEGPVGAKESREIPRVLSRWVVVCQEDDAAASGLSDGTQRAVAGAASPIPHAHVGLWEQGEQTRG